MHFTARIQSVGDNIITFPFSITSSFSSTRFPLMLMFWPYVKFTTSSVKRMKEMETGSLNSLKIMVWVISMILSYKNK